MKATWSLSASQILSELAVNPEVGLPRLEASRRLKKYGLNTLVAKKRATRWQLFFKQVKNPVVYILIIAASVAFALNELHDGIAILAIVILNTLIGYVQESKAEASIEALAAISSPRARVLRDGNVISILSEEVCRGDILMLEAGDYVPADARVITSRQLAADESILTGESLPIEKSSEEIPENTQLADRKNMLFANTAISSGTAKAVVIATGRETEIGSIAEMLETTESEVTPLQIRLEGVSRKLLWVGAGVILFVVIVGLYQERPWIEVLMLALSLSIAAIPEGLPTVVTVALVMAVHRMSRKKALVRKMDSVETLGATDIICTDKTGTLTTGKMQVRETFTLKDSNRDLFLKNMIHCNNASLDQGGSGDTTEIALLEFAKNKGLIFEKLRADEHRLYEWSFDSDRKRMSVAVNTNGKCSIFVKGAPESILPLCHLSDDVHCDITSKISEYSKNGMRVLAYAWKESALFSHENISAEEAESDLIFLGLTAMADPPKVESMAAIKKCQEAGIRVIMITGDHPQTAAAIALELGIISSTSDRVLIGKEIDSLSEQEFIDASKSVSVYARVSPANKLKLVTALKSQGHVVAMTGDGVNDAPALKIASIGVAMGKGGTEVARQASSMVLTDDNFATIVDAVEEGRAVNGNIKRTLQYLLSTNLAELMFILTSICIGWPIPLLPVNLLWLNLVSDGLPSLALAAEKVPHHFLEESSKPSADTFFDKEFYQEMILVGAVITFMCLGVYYYGLEHYDLLTARSLAFSLLVYSILFRSFSCRSEKKTFFEMKPNIYHLVAVIFPILLQLGIPHLEVTKDILKITALSYQMNIVLLLLAIIPVTFMELYKIVRR